MASVNDGLWETTRARLMRIGRGYQIIQNEDEEEVDVGGDAREKGDAHSAQLTGASRPQQPSRIIPVVLILLILFTTILFFYASKSISATPLDLVNPDYDPQTSDGGDLARLLHPELHLGRQPKTIRHDWNITLGSRRPDGVLKTVYLVNDHFPGPTIEAVPGDTVEVSVFNGLQDEGIAIHWHGLHMQNANEMDGAAGITQHPIEPAQSFTYRFIISEHQHGSFWYHAHDRVQRGDGLYGGFVVHSPGNPNRIQQDRLLMIGDWYHQSARETLDRYMEPGTFGNEPVPDSMVINDKGAYTCADASPARPVDCVDTKKMPSLSLKEGETYRLRFINTGTLAGFTFSLPSVNLTVVAVDGGGATSPMTSSKFGVIYPGQRVDFLVQVPQGVSGSYLELELDDENFRDPNPALTAVQRFPINSGTLSRHIAPADQSRVNLLEAVSAAGDSVFPDEINETMVIYTNTLKLAHRANVPHGYINQTSWEEPATPLLETPRSSWDANQLVPSIPLGAWVDLVINNVDDGGHPFHLHGYSFHVLQTSARTSFWGSYNPFEGAAGPPGGALNLKNPLRRDTVFVPARGYVVLRLHADNPGLWFAHCHLLTHQASGMAMTFQVGEHKKQEAGAG